MTNGKEIYEVVLGIDKRLVAIETKQEERHTQNQKDIKSLHRTIDNVIKLKTQVFFQWFFIGAVFVGIITIVLKGL